MRKLSPIDMAFLLAEGRNQPFHVGALCIFDPPKDAPEDFAAEIAGRLRASTAAAPPFNRRLESNWGVKSWVESADFDLAQHFVHLSLPKPGRILELLAMVSRVHSAHLDRAYPLWRTYLIEGIEDGRIALYSKIHHSLVDGVAGLRLMMKSMSPDPLESTRMPAPWELHPYRVSKRASSSAAAVSSTATAMHLLRSGLASTPTVLKHLQHFVHDYRAHNRDLVTSVQAPNTILNSRVTGSRRFAAQSYSTARIKRISQAFDATCNDIVLALCGAALRRYLLELDALPDKPLTAIVPVSLRRDSGDTGNEIAFALCTLATHISDPLERVRLVKGCMDYNKAMLHDMTSHEILAYSVATLAPGLLTFLPGINHNHRVANVVISHVPGPREEVYWQGCRLDGMYPASLVLDGFALNITLISRHDNIDFGIIACRKSLPSAQRLLIHLETALEELEVALGFLRREDMKAGKAPNRRKQVSVRSAAA